MISTISFLKKIRAGVRRRLPNFFLRTRNNQVASANLCSTQDWCAAHPEAEFVFLESEQKTIITPPLSLNDEDETNRYPSTARILPRFVAVIPEGNVCHNGLIFTSDRYVLHDACPQGQVARKTATPLPFPNLNGSSSVRVENTVAILSSLWPDNYYHWMFDIVPRLHLLEQAGIKAEKFIVNCHTAFQAQTLKLLGIAQENCIPDLPNRHLTVRKLVVPSLPGPIGNPPHWACNYLREALLFPLKGSVSPKIPALRKPIYISRADAPGRRVTNEDQVLRLLEPKGFQAVTLEGMNLTEQILLFHHAQAIIAPHGAALTNLVFCQPQTPVIEFTAPGWSHPMYNHISMHGNLRFGCLIGEGQSPAIANDEKYCQQNITVNLAELEAMLNKMEM